MTPHMLTWAISLAAVTSRYLHDRAEQKATHAYLRDLLAEATPLVVVSRCHRSALQR